MMSAQGAWDSDVISVEGLCMRYRTLDVLREVAFRVHREAGTGPTSRGGN